PPRHPTNLSLFPYTTLFRSNPLSGLVMGVAGRGAGVELRVYGCDPDLAEVKARAGGWTVLAGSMDKPHGLRECAILDDQGYCWLDRKSTRLNSSHSQISYAA